MGDGFHEATVDGLRQMTDSGPLRQTINGGLRQMTNRGPHQMADDGRQRQWRLVWLFYSCGGCVIARAEETEPATVAVCRPDDSSELNFHQSVENRIYSNSTKNKSNK